MTQATPETLEHTTLSGISIKSPHQSSGNPTKRRQKECESQRGWRASGEQVPLNQPSKAYRNSQRLKQQVQCLRCYVPGSLHIRYSFQFSVSMGLLSVWMSGSLILVSSLRFFFRWCDFSKYHVMIMVYHILLYLFCCYALEACSF